jgi:hypothetical protein
MAQCVDSFLPCFSFALAPGFAHAWNAAGHRLVAAIAWQQLSPPSRDFIATALARHPDHARWAERARSSEDPSTSLPKPPPGPTTSATIPLLRRGA